LGEPIRPLLALVLTVAPVTLPLSVDAQTAAADTTPERVVDRLYDAINRCDGKAISSLFAPVWFHSALEDTASAPRRLTREEFVSGLMEWCHPPKPRFKMLHRIVMGPYVVDEQAVLDKGRVHLDMFEVRNGKIVKEWEGGWEEVK
jgi:hypothetical protein